MYEYINSILSILPAEILMILISTLTGLLIGIEREWSNRPSGIRTFTIVSLTGTSLAITGYEGLIYIGGVMVILLTVYTIISNYVENQENIPLTTTITIFLVYSIGVLIGTSQYTIGITLAIILSIILVSKKELHKIADKMTEEEIKSTTKFVVIAVLITIYIPDKTIGPYNSINLQLVWSLIVGIAAIGFINYILFKKYQKKGLIITSFLGSLVNSTATIIELSTRSKNNKIDNKSITSLILISNISMILRNLLIVIIFIPIIIETILIPIITITLSLTISILYLTKGKPQNISKQKQNEKIDLKTPFSIKNVTIFGVLFIILLTTTAALNQIIGEQGVLTASFLGGAISSGTVISSITILTRTGDITNTIATTSIILGIFSSIIIKIIILMTKKQKTIAKNILIHSVIAITVGIITIILQNTV